MAWGRALLTSSWILAITLCCAFVQHAQATPPLRHALTPFNTPAKYSHDFTAFDYVNVNAPTGGTLRRGSFAPFNSLNPFILNGLPAPGLWGAYDGLQTSALVFESLMTPSLDEPMSYYPLVAMGVSISNDGRYVSFVIHPQARFSDGHAIDATDVVYSFNILREQGHPGYALQLKGVKEAKAMDTRTVRFEISDTSNRELPFLVASLPVIPEHIYSTRDFASSSMLPAVGSGAYLIEKAEAGRSITFKRNPDYWGWQLPTRRGMFNIERIRFDVYRDNTIALEAFKANRFDLYEEFIARSWATSYTGKAVEEGRLRKYTAPHKIPRGMQGFIFNLRKDRFADRRVREALSLCLDFTWMNRTLFYDAYTRNTSFFQSTAFEATGLPSNGELQLLHPYREILPEALFKQPFSITASDGSGYIRERLKRADALLNEAGWVLRGGVRVHKDTGEVLTVEFLNTQKTFERVFMAMGRNLSKIGVVSKFRLVDDAQYAERIKNNDFDLISIWWNVNLHLPGNEQRGYWHSEAADVIGSQNYSGMKHKAVDALLERISQASSLPALLDAGRALDRVLLWEHVVIPHWSINHFRVVYWNMFGMPNIRPDYGLGLETWWINRKEPQNE